MKLKAIALATSLALASSPAMADPGDWSSDRYGVTALSGSCVMSSTFSYAGRPDIELGVFAYETHASIFVGSSPWSVSHGQVYDAFGFAFRTPDSLYTDGESTGYVENGKNGFLTGLPSEALDDLGRAQRLIVFKSPTEGGDLTIVADFNLIGSGAAVAALKRCLSTVLARNEAQRRREARFDHIARDPFAPSTSAAPAPTAPPEVSWSRAPQPHFPDRAKERGITSATVKLSCSTATNGLPENCSIISENPPGAGFGREALSAMRSSRFSPAVATFGGTYLFTIDFSLD